MKDRNWINLITSLKSNRCVLVLGPDLATSSQKSEDGGSTVEPVLQLSRLLSDDCEDEGIQISDGSLMSLCQHYEDARDLGPGALRARVASYYQSHEFSPSDMHRVIATLPFSLILTTRHDPVYEDMLKHEGKSPTTGRYSMRRNQRKNPDFEIESSVQEPYLYRLFGDPLEPDTLVLTESDVLDFAIAISSDKPSLPLGLVKTLKQSGQSFLFLGFGIKDWYLRVLLKIILRVLDVDRSGITVATESLHDISEFDRSTTVLFFRRGKRVEVEDCDPLEFVIELKRRLEDAGGIPTPVVYKGTIIRTFICHANEDAALAKDLQISLAEKGIDAWLDVRELKGGQEWDSEIRSELESTDFVLVIYSDSLYRKTDSYVNKEIHLAKERALRVRKEYIIPLRTDDLQPDQAVEALSLYQDMPLSRSNMENHVQALVSVLKRAYQLRGR